MVKVSILTPVFNGGAFLRTCIDSVLRQTHTHWEYIIVNNCSTDDSLQIANEYAARDPRIKVYSNDRFVSGADNHNIAFSRIAADSRYVKVVAADDWISDDCVAKMVALGERHPSAAIIGCYQRSDDRLLWTGLAPEQTLVNGREIGRRSLLEGLNVFGPPTGVLYRADIVRARNPKFLPHGRSHADTDLCYELMAEHDYGFVHEVLSFDRVHPNRVTTTVLSLNAGGLAYLEALIRYGGAFMSAEEHAARRTELLDGYYVEQGRALLRLRGIDYWRFHIQECRIAGIEFRFSRVLLGALSVLGKALRQPRQAMTRCSQLLRGQKGTVP